MFEFITYHFKLKKMDTPGIEPGAFRMQIERDTTTPHTLIESSVYLMIKRLMSLYK